MFNKKPSQDIVDSIHCISTDKLVYFRRNEQNNLSVECVFIARENTKTHQIIKE